MKGQSNHRRFLQTYKALWYDCRRFVWRGRIVRPSARVSNTRRVHALEGSNPSLSAIIKMGLSSKFLKRRRLSGLRLFVVIYPNAQKSSIPHFTKQQWDKTLYFPRKVPCHISRSSNGISPYGRLKFFWGAIP